MAAPTNPTGTSIVTEAMKRGGYSSPTAAQLTRAEDEWLEEVKDDIVTRSFRDGNTRLKTLQNVDVQISIDNQSYVAVPSDFDEEIKIEVLDGSETGTATAGANTTITLAADEDITQANAEGAYLLITGGTGANGLRQILSYDTTTKVATVDSAWGTNPDNTSTYLVVDTFNELEEQNITEMEEGRTSPGLPEYFHKVNEGVNERIYFDRPFDKGTYGVRITYFANIRKVDLTEGSTLISKIYQNWESALKQGVYVKTLEDDNDSAHSNALTVYNNMVDTLLMKEIPYGGEFIGFEVE